MHALYCVKENDGSKKVWFIFCSIKWLEVIVYIKKRAKEVIQFICMKFMHWKGSAFDIWGEASRLDKLVKKGSEDDTFSSLLTFWKNDFSLSAKIVADHVRQKIDATYM